MHHTTTAPRLQSDNLHAERIARLSEEYLTATPARCEQIGAEISGMIDGKIAAIGVKGQ